MHTVIELKMYEQLRLFFNLARNETLVHGAGTSIEEGQVKQNVLGCTSAFYSYILKGDNVLFVLV